MRLVKLDYQGSSILAIITNYYTGKNGRSVRLSTVYEQLSTTLIYLNLDYKNHFYAHMLFSQLCRSHRRMRSVKRGLTLIKEITLETRSRSSPVHPTPQRRRRDTWWGGYVVRSMPSLRENIVPNLYVCVDLSVCSEKVCKRSSGSRIPAAETRPRNNQLS